MQVVSDDPVMIKGEPRCLAGIMQREVFRIICRARFTASLSDGSAAPYTVTVSDLATAFDRRVAIDYRAATPGSTLTLTYTMAAGTGNVTFQAVTLQGTTVNQAPPMRTPRRPTLSS